MPKRKISAVAAATPAAGEGAVLDRSKMRRSEVPLPPNVAKPPRRQSTRGGTAATTDPNRNPDIIDGIMALRASPDGHEDDGPESHLKPNGVNAPSDATTENNALSSAGVNGAVPTSNATSANSAGKNRRKKVGAQHVKVEDEESNIGTVNGVKENVTAPARAAAAPGDPEADEGPDAENEDEEEVKEALSRPPPVNSEYLPLPWKGRLGYVCNQRTFIGLGLTKPMFRLVSTPISVTPNLPSLALERVVLPASSNIAIP